MQPLEHPDWPDDEEPAPFPGVRDVLRAELGGDPVTWHLVERVLEAVARTRGPGEPMSAGPPVAPVADDVSRAAVRRGLPPDTALDDLLEHERAAGRTLTIADFSTDMRAASEEIATLRHALTAVEEVVQTVRDSPALDRGGAQEEALRWVLGLLESALSPASPLLDDRLLAERHHVADVAADLAGLRGLDRAAFIARVLEASNDGPA